jgi:hypothetical protein
MYTSDGTAAGAVILPTHEAEALLERGERLECEFVGIEWGMVALRGYADWYA